MMDSNLHRISNNAIKIVSLRSFTDNEIKQLFDQYGKIDKIVSENNYKMIYFNSEEAAERCMKDLDHILAAFRSVDFDFDCTGDTACKSDKSENFSKIKRLFKQLTQTKLNQIECEKVFTDNKPSTNSASASGKFLPSCSSPVLLSSADPGFRLAYCHNVMDFHSSENKTKIKKKSFNQSIKKYIDDTFPSGIQDLMLTNLPTNIKKEDIYKLCGQIQPASIELKTTANINVLYAYIKLNSKDDFNKLNHNLCNCYVDGMKITSVPITKMTESQYLSPEIFAALKK
ncbi:uncharacterized protein LOC135831811 [Planococcus citri]|uniref:uncharacterized protein LOC135831811 n=1 Tax=Planococcus citri TaxID=170843 RepID=UPI0031F786D3